jgi:hypothetical protein
LNRPGASSVYRVGAWLFGAFRLLVWYWDNRSTINDQFSRRRASRRLRPVTKPLNFFHRVDRPAHAATVIMLLPGGTRAGTSTCTELANPMLVPVRQEAQATTPTPANRRRYYRLPGMNDRRKLSSMWPAPFQPVYRNVPDGVGSWPRRTLARAHRWLTCGSV